MAKNFRIRDRLLFGLAVFADVLDEIVGGGSRAYHARKLFIYTPPGYKTDKVSQAVSRMLAAHDLEKKVINGEPFLQITGMGKSKLVKNFPLLKWQKRRFDGYWRLVVFDIRETDRRVRQEFRRKLLDLGFGYLQRSVYISPYDVAEDMQEFIQLHNLGDQVFISVGKQLLAEDFTELVVRVWGLEKLNNDYQKLYDQWQKKGDNFSVADFRKLMDRYLEILSQDPFLPMEMLPKPWYGVKLSQVFKKERKKIYAKLSN
ncbi:MAG: PaaX family transcriptional regulator C-terminal domain-containing protein [Patescibacteria group bacterium]|nr:PaaX family transcriptional regulator C-terminal domain-containing protein [Patescibacteria group bacterium]